MIVLLVHHQVKNAGRKLGRRCDMCSNYEKQLQAIQGQEAETRDQVCVFITFLLQECWTSNHRLFKELVLGLKTKCPPGEETAGDAPSGQRSAGEDDDGETDFGGFCQSGKRGNGC